MEWNISLCANSAENHVLTSWKHINYIPIGNNVIASIGYGIQKGVWNSYDNKTPESLTPSRKYSIQTTYKQTTQLLIKRYERGSKGERAM